MAMRESKGNMYPFVTHTWNPIKGKCPHGCEYCYMRRFPLKELRLDEKELRTDLGSGKFIFVGSSTDMWAEAVPGEWISAVLDKCRDHPSNRYLFQSKNPAGFIVRTGLNVVYGTTIETNRKYPCMGDAPPIWERVNVMEQLVRGSYMTMVTIEPILDFDLPALVALVRTASPEWVNIGADSKGHGLPEPSREKVRALIEQLRTFTTVKLKGNLGRIAEAEER